MNSSVKYIHGLGLFVLKASQTGKIEILTPIVGVFHFRMVNVLFSFLVLCYEIINT